MEDTMQPRELYGGAIVAQLPTRFRDVSDFRPVPDHQEVFADPQEDQSLVLEIVEHDTSISDQDCARHYWDDQVACNQSLSSTVNEVIQLGPTDVPHLPPSSVSYACCISGVQVASKGRQSADTANQVAVMLAVLRLPSVKSDVLITLNSPMVISATSQAAEHAGAGVKQRFQAAPQLLRQVLASLQVVDWGLFGSSPA